MLARAVGESGRFRMLAALAANTQRSRPERLCSVCAEVLSVTGAGVVVMREGRSGVTVCASDSVAATVEELQFALGEGPCIDAYVSNRPVFEGDLARFGASRWPGFSPPAVAAGVGAVFGFPLQADDVAIGALNLYQSHPGGMSTSQLADALGVVDIVTAELMAWEAEVGVAQVLDELDGRFQLRAVVHQATGMVSAQLDVTLDDAFARLQAAAFGQDRTLVDVSEDVLARRLVLE